MTDVLILDPAFVALRDWRKDNPQYPHVVLHKVEPMKPKPRPAHAKRPKPYGLKLIFNAPDTGDEVYRDSFRDCSRKSGRRPYRGPRPKRSEVFHARGPLVLMPDADPKVAYRIWMHSTAPLIIGDLLELDEVPRSLFHVSAIHQRLVGRSLVDLRTTWLPTWLDERVRTRSKLRFHRAVIWMKFRR